MEPFEVLAQHRDPVAAAVGGVAAQRVLPHQRPLQGQVDVGAVMVEDFVNRGVGLDLRQRLELA